MSQYKIILQLYFMSFEFCCLFFPVHFLAGERHTYFLCWNFRIAKRQIFHFWTAFISNAVVLTGACTGECETIKFYKCSYSGMTIWFSPADLPT